jgi:hypothetical protein
LPATSPSETVADLENVFNELDTDDPLVQDAMAFAEDQGITVEEALRRLQHQQTIGDIQPFLEADLPETYGGLWVEHQPEYRIVIALTKGDEVTVRPYISDRPWAEFVEVRQVLYSLNELEEAQKAAMQIADELRIVVSTSIDVVENRVELRVGNPDLFRGELAAAGIELSELVEIDSSEPGRPVPDTNHGVLVEAMTADGRKLFLPKQPPTSVWMMALINDGSLIEANGCLRVTTKGYDEGFLILWPHDTDIRVAGDKIELLNGEGQVAARVGDELRIAGGAMESPPSMARYDELIPGLPIDGCPGPYWVAGELETLAAQAVPDIYVDPFTSDGRLLAFFIHQSRPAKNEGSLSGTLLVNDQGCIQVEGNTILWPPGVYLREDPFRLVDSSEETIANIGEEIWISGAEKSSQEYRYFSNNVQCPGPYWGAAEATAPGEPAPTANQLPFVEEFGFTIVDQLGGVPRAVAADGGFVYVGFGPRILVIDASDATNPQLLGQSEPLPGLIRGIEVSEGIAYVAAEWAGLIIIDVSDPSNVQILNNGPNYWSPDEETVRQPWARSVTVIDDTAYLFNKYP